MFDWLHIHNDKTEHYIKYFSFVCACCLHCCLHVFAVYMYMLFICICCLHVYVVYLYLLFTWLCCLYVFAVYMCMLFICICCLHVYAKCITHRALFGIRVRLLVLISSFPDC